MIITAQMLGDSDGSQRKPYQGSDPVDLRNIVFFMRYKDSKEWHLHLESELFPRPIVNASFDEKELKSAGFVPLNVGIVDISELQATPVLAIILFNPRKITKIIAKKNERDDGTCGWHASYKDDPLHCEIAIGRTKFHFLVAEHDLQAFADACRKKPDYEITWARS